MNSPGKAAPKPSGHGMFEKKPLVYFTMPRFGQNLRSILVRKDFDIPESTMYQIGLNVLNILELVHDSGYVFNDLKLENILLGNSYDVPDEMSSDFLNDAIQKGQLVLTDFGLASLWKDKEMGDHLPQT